jgi:hypothetical protein
VGIVLVVIGISAFTLPYGPTRNLVDRTTLGRNRKPAAERNELRTGQEPAQRGDHRHQPSR